MRYIVIAVVLVIVVILFIAGCSGSAELNNSANGYFQSGNYDTAINTYRSAQVTSPDDPAAYINSASALAASGDLDGAAAALEYVIGTGDPTYRAHAYYNLGNIYFQMGRYVDAVTAYREVLLMNPDDEDARYNMELALGHIRLPTPTAIEQQTEPDNAQADTSATPTNNPGGFDGPTPTPPPQDAPPDLSATPTVFGNTDDGRIGEGTPLPQEGGDMTVNEAERVLDSVEQSPRTLREYLQDIATPQPPAGQDW